jgi:hypothetical protein
MKQCKGKLDREEMIRAYEEGYRIHPENLIEIRALEKASIETLTDEAWQ